MICTEKLNCECVNCNIKEINNTFGLSLMDLKTSVSSKLTDLQWQFVRDQVLGKVEKFIDDFDFVEVAEQIIEDNNLENTHENTHE